MLEGRQLSGLTQIEFVVVVVICAMLASLLTPALQNVREQSRRTQCENHLRQIGLACNSYHDAYGYFPIGRTSQTNASWGILLLPNLGEPSHYDRFATGSIPSDETALLTDLEVFRCPSATGMETPGMSNYLGCWGAGDDISRDISSSAEGDGGGILIQDKGIRIRDVKDGTTNTLLIGESLNPPAGSAAVASAQIYKWGGSNIGQICGDTRRPINTATATSFEANNFASNHTGGALFLVADGAVRFVSETINYDQTNFDRTQGLFQNLCDRRDLSIVRCAWAND